MTNEEPTANELVGKEMADILGGCVPSLVRELADMHGLTPEQTNARFRQLPFGDRVTLAAYGCAEHDDRLGGYSALPKLVDVTSAAHRLVDVTTTS